MVHTTKTYLHLIHALLSVPMQKCLPLEHGRELIAYTFEQLLDGSRVAQECHSHFQASWRYVALSSEYIVGNPLHKVRRILVLDVLHLLFNFFHGDFAAEDSGDLGRNKN